MNEENLPHSDEPDIKPEIFSPEIKVEVHTGISPDEAQDEVDQILEQLESDSSFPLAEKTLSQVTSTIENANKILRRSSEVLRSGGIALKTYENYRGSLAPNALEISSSNPSQDLCVSSSMKETVKFDSSKLFESSESEHNNEVTSTTNVTFSPHIKTSPSLASWLMNKPNSPRKKIWRFNCKVCDFSAFSYSTLYTHFKRYHPRIIRRGNLSKFYSKNLGHMLKKKDPTLYVCPYCNYVTLSKKGFLTHTSRRHPRKKANPNKNGTPISTEENRKYLERLYISKNAPDKYLENVKHLLTLYHPDSKCLAQELGTEDAPRFRFRKSHYLAEKKCILCRMQFSSQRLLFKHYRIKHSEQGPRKNSTSGLYHCKLCSHDTVSRSALRLHYSRTHFMDAFYAWNVPFLEEDFKEREKRRNCSPESNHCGNVLTESINDIFPEISVDWDENLTDEGEIAPSQIPCILCDFSSKKLVCLLSHYQKNHDEQYPKGFKGLLIKCLSKHTKSVKVPTSNVHLAHGPHGGWLDENGHMLQVHKYGCQLCSLKSNKFQDMRGHFSTAHPNVKNYAQHINSIRITDESKRTPVFKCQICEYTSNNVGNDMGIHYTEHHPSIVFDPTKLTASSNPPVVQYECDMCTFKGNSESMQWHYAQCHDSSEFSLENFTTKVVQKQPPVISCYACEFSANRTIDVAFHYERCHANEAITFTTPIHDDGYQCVLCKAITQTLNGMIRHHRKHTSLHKPINVGKTWKAVDCLYCKHCRRVFATTKYLWCHIIQQHFKPAQLVSVADLPSHVVKHGYWDTDETQIGPDVLMRAQNSKPDLFSDTDVLVKRQMFSMQFRKAGFSDENEMPAWKCKQCFSHFDSKKKLSQHVCKSASGKSRTSPKSQHRQTRLIEKRVQCKFCPLTTTHHQNLRRHLQAVHRHDVSFRCFKCNEETTNVASCVKHHQYVHGMNIGRPTALNFLLHDIVEYSEDEIRFMCCWCGYKGFSRTLVLNHLNSRHIQSKDKPKNIKFRKPRFFCKWCECSSRSSHSMRGHINARHSRTVSYQTLLSMKRFDSDSCPSGDSSDKSDEEYLPSPKDRQQISRSPKKTNFILNEECSFENDSDYDSNSEEYRSTHVRCKHQIRYPHLCKYCMSAFVCSTAFQLHAVKEHAHWCSISSCAKNLIVLPDAKAIPRTLAKLKEDYDVKCNKSIFHNSHWPCEICKGRYFESAVHLQEHIWEVHNAQRILMCRYCEFISFSENKILLHVQQHARPDIREENVHEANTSSLSCSHQMSTESNPKNLIESDVGMISDNAIDEIPELSSVVLRTNPYHLSPKVSRRARKSTRRSEMKPSSPVIAEEASTSRVLLQPSSVSDATDKRGETLISGDEVDIHVKCSLAFSGLIRCNKCAFYCTDQERMKSHMRATHLSTKEYACKFCDYISENFMELDDHLAEFHKIKKNHQLGLQLRFSADGDDISNEAAMQSISDMKSRFLYTPTPCLPILRERIKYIDEHDEPCVSNSTDQKPSSPEVEIIEPSDERFQCSYCGFVAQSTDKLEQHMGRHERNFQADPGSVDNMNYNLNKMGMVYKFP